MFNRIVCNRDIVKIYHYSYTLTYHLELTQCGNKVRLQSYSV